MIRHSLVKTASACSFIALFAACGSNNLNTNTGTNAAHMQLFKKDLSKKLPEFEKSVSDIERMQIQTRQQMKTELGSFTDQDKQKLSFDSTFGKYDEILDIGNTFLNRMYIIQATSIEEIMRDKATEAIEELTNDLMKLSFRQDIFDVLNAFAKSPKGKRLKGEDARMMELTLLDFTRAGLAQPPDIQEQLKVLNASLIEDTNAISMNMVKESATLRFSDAELQGVSEDFKTRTRTPAGDYEVKVNSSPNYAEIMQNAVREETRKTFVNAYYKRAMNANQELINRVLRTRVKIAKLLGYKNWADYQIAPKMAKEGKTAYKLVNDLGAMLESKFQSEQAEFKALKGSEIQIWDVPFYISKLQATKYAVDSAKIKEYFTLDRTLAGMFETYEDVFSIRIKEIDAPYKWVEGLKLFEVSDKLTGHLNGYIYMDMYPREGKYGHFAMFPIHMARQTKSGYRTPVASLVCNFNAPVGDKPSLLSHDDVTTVFHEFGHALHHVLTRSNFAKLSGTNVPGDFVETPSQLLERWAWDPAVLKRFAVHYADPTKTLPQETLEKMEAARKSTVAHQYRRQLVFGSMDLSMHSYQNESEIPADMFVESNKSFEKFFYKVPEGTGFLASFGHLFGGYDAGYYGYAWADSITADIATKFQDAKKGYDSKILGYKLRQEIYAKGNSRDPNESIEAFLGRPWNLEAFATYLGVQK